MSEHDQNLEVDPAGESWTWLVGMTVALFLLGATGLLLHYYTPAPTNDLQDQVRALSQQVQLLKQEQAMPVVVLNRYRNSICYVFGVYQVGFPNQPARLRARVSGTGFIVASGLMATNRHVSEPWYGDPEADALIRRGAVPTLEKLVAFFPGSPTAFELTPTVVSAHSDLAILHVEFSQTNRNLEP
ncbi:MAG TPA: hypothetical protein VLL05_00940, partial [Terriglobales bacterium]|nr:hypothetical protein [Terriglobales bacterium]